MKIQLLLRSTTSIPPMKMCVGHVNPKYIFMVRKIIDDVNHNDAMKNESIIVFDIFSSDIHQMARREIMAVMRLRCLRPQVDLRLLE